MKEFKKPVILIMSAFGTSHTNLLVDCHTFFVSTLGVWLPLFKTVALAALFHSAAKVFFVFLGLRPPRGGKDKPRTFEIFYPLALRPIPTIYENLKRCPCALHPHSRRAASVHSEREF